MTTPRPGLLHEGRPEVCPICTPARAVDPSSVNVPAADILALADNRDVKYPVRFKQTPSENFVFGWARAMEAVRALVDAAERPDEGWTDDEIRQIDRGESFAAPPEPLCRCGHPVGHRGKHAPVPVSDEAPPPEPTREQIAAEIEKQGREVVEWLACHRSDDLDMGRLIGTEDAYKDAVRIVREEKFELADLAPSPPPVSVNKRHNDTAEEAWEAWMRETWPDISELALASWRTGVTYPAFLAGFRVGRETK